MFTIEMGGCDIVLSVEWLRTLIPITMDFLELYMSFKKDEHSYTLKGLKAGSSKIVSSHCMENHKKGHSIIITQFYNIQVFKDVSQLVHPSFN
jgi:hypothetical protein